MKIYTRTGDLGTTSLVGGIRTSKDTPRLEAYGTVDELNSFLGLLMATPGLPADTLPTLTLIQNKLFNLGAYLATDTTTNPTLEPQGLGHETISNLEHQIDLLTDRIPPMHCFILPGGTQAAAQAHVCRAVCRRAERRTLTLAATAPLSPLPLRFLNRLSDYLFTLARYINHTASTPDIPWQKD